MRESRTQSIYWATIIKPILNPIRCTVQALLYDILVGNCELKSAYDDPSFLESLPFCHLET